MSGFRRLVTVQKDAENTGTFQYVPHNYVVGYSFGIRRFRQVDSIVWSIYVFLFFITSCTFNDVSHSATAADRFTNMYEISHDWRVSLFSSSYVQDERSLFFMKWILRTKRISNVALDFNCCVVRCHELKFSAQWTRSVLHSRPNMCAWENHLY